MKCNLTPYTESAEDPKSGALLMVDLLTHLVLSGSTEEPDNTNGSKSNHQHKEAFWRQVEMRNLTYTHTPKGPLTSPHLTPLKSSLRSLTPSKGGKRALTEW